MADGDKICRMVNGAPDCDERYWAVTNDGKYDWMAGDGQWRDGGELCRMVTDAVGLWRMVTDGKNDGKNVNEM